jgi:hypothetical protein
MKDESARRRLDFHMAKNTRTRPIGLARPGRGLSILCFLACAALAVRAADFDRDAWLADYAAMKQALEKTYSNLAWFGSPQGGVDLPALDRQTMAALNAATSDEEARRVVLTFVRSFHDGHFSALRAPNAQNDAAEKPAEPQFSPQDAAAGCAALDYGSVRASAFSLPFDSLPKFELLDDGAGRPFRAGIVPSPDGKLRLGIVRIPEFESNYRALCLEVWQNKEVWDAQGKLRRGPLSRAADQAWYDAFAGLLRKFKEAEVAAVLVDVGNNSGGGDSGDITPRLLTAMPLHSAPLWMTQDSAASSRYFDEQITALRRAVDLAPENRQAKESLAWFTQQKEKLSQPCPLDWVWKQRRDWSSGPCRRLVEAGSAGGPLAYLAPNAEADVRVTQRLHWPALVTPLWATWTGPLYLWTDNRTYSAAEMFAAVLQNNHAATILGSRTGGDGCGFMSRTDPLVLPHSGLRFRIPNCVRLRADGTDEVAGISPDIPVAPKEGEDAAARAKRAVDELYANLSRRR